MTDEPLDDPLMSAIVETQRLVLRKLSLADAPFILTLLNEPSFIQNIGDKGVRTLADARAYIQNGPMANYRKFGFGLLLVETKDGAKPAGICGLLKRDTLPDVDIGYALLPEFWSKGYAIEAAKAVLVHAQEVLKFGRVLAITSPGNEASIRVLEKLGFKYQEMIRMGEDAAETKLFAVTMQQATHQ